MHLPTKEEIGPYAFKSPGFSENLLWIKLRAVLEEGCSGYQQWPLWLWINLALPANILATTCFQVFFFFFLWRDFLCKQSTFILKQNCQ